MMVSAKDLVLTSTEHGDLPFTALQDLLETQTIGSRSQIFSASHSLRLQQSSSPSHLIKSLPSGSQSISLSLINTPSNSASATKSVPPKNISMSSINKKLSNTLLSPSGTSTPPPYLPSPSSTIIGTASRIVFIQWRNRLSRTLVTPTAPQQASGKTAFQFLPIMLRLDPSTFQMPEEFKKQQLSLNAYPLFMPLREYHCVDLQVPVPTSRADDGFDDGILDT
ncbi:hypothetical protein EDD22DRAFT_855684 [Suillus occidentalis]|nr:hypothetical protein EDD22DRAFT_855684 [Suillus occidentalis]